MLTPEDVAEFRRSLAETIAWCGRPEAQKADGAGLRTAALRPASLVVASPAEAPEVVRLLAARRGQLVEEQGAALPPGEGLRGGRLLLYYPAEVIGCASAELASGGFLDADDAPPWDTWVWYVPQEGAVVCWIPPAFLKLAHEGARAAPTESLRWADDVRGEFTDRLRAAGLLGR
jgi:hypothetical protein